MNNKVIYVRNLAECLHKCMQQTSFNCRSIDYRTSNGCCNLSTSTSTSSNYREPCYNNGFVYTERL